MTLTQRPTSLLDLVSMRESLDRLFDDRFFRPMWLATSDRPIAPALDLYTTPDSVVARVALPGVKPEEVDVTIADDVITVAGTFKTEQETTEAGYVHKELSHGSFQRSFTVPVAIKAESAKAEFKDGLLILTLPKTEEVRPTHIKVTPV
jgi:HSP20 family protein